MKIYKEIKNLAGVGQFNDIEICGNSNGEFYPVFIKNTEKVVYRFRPKEFVPFLIAINALDQNFFEKINDSYKKFSYACSLMAENSKVDHLKQKEFLDHCKKILLRKQVNVVCKE